MCLDCLLDEIIEYLVELLECMYVMVELGLQIIYEIIFDLINCVYFYELYVEMVKCLRKYFKIEIVFYLINGFFGEIYEMMIENVCCCVMDNDI